MNLTYAQANQMWRKSYRLYSETGKQKYYNICEWIAWRMIMMDLK